MPNDDTEKYRVLLPLLTKFVEQENANLKILLDLSTEAGAVRKEEVARMPLHINIIQIAAAGKLRETAHSAILQQLLMHPTILNSFICSMLEMQCSGINTENVRIAEQDRMDVSIYAPDRCIIIENKVNGASEQPGQIFRYVGKAIADGYSEDQISVLYLNPDNHNSPSDYSLTEDGGGKKRIPDSIEKTLLIKDYAHDIYNWIKALPSSIKSTESYLLSALLQYQDYLEEMFYLSDKYAPMKERIQKLIRTEILGGIDSANDPDYSERIKILASAIEDMDILLAEMNALRRNMETDRDRKHIIEAINDPAFELIDMTSYGYSERNSGIRISINRSKEGFIAYGYGKYPYIGIATDCKNLTDDEKNALLSLMKNFGKNPAYEPLWASWDYIVNQPLPEGFSKFVNFVKNYDFSGCTTKIELIHG